MGQEIESSQFRQEDFSEFQHNLKQETNLLAEWFQNDAFSAAADMGGFELEAWLVDEAFKPTPINEEYLARLNSDWVSPELSRFNVELNGEPLALHGDALRRLHDGLQENLNYCQLKAQEMDARLVIVGILPSLEEHQLTLANMSKMERYRALNEQVFRQREGKPLQLNIVGREHIRTTHYNVMLESATTSFQIHRQTKLKDAVRVYNAAQIISAPMVAISANAPYLFGKDLWDETRIPLFEQSVEVGGFDGAAHGPMRRVSFGTGFVRDSLLECFMENLEHYPILLPECIQEDHHRMHHVRLHNGTIWRWNRPLIGYDTDGTPHLRIEHRVVSAGPSIIDDMANAAFFYGLVEYYLGQATPAEQRISFAEARDNFYAAARSGLDAQVTWLDKQNGMMRNLILEQLLPQARRGLASLDIDATDIVTYMDLLEQRVKSGQTGSGWQRAWVEQHGPDMQGLTARYAANQAQKLPVHQWKIAS